MADSAERLAIQKPGRRHPGVGVGAVVIGSGGLLMVRRDGAHGAGTWSVPGGWVEMWEDPLAAAEREVREETGLVVRACRSLGWTDSPHTDDGVHAITLWVRCKYLAGVAKVVEPDKCPEVEWVPLGAVERRTLFQPLDRWWPSFLLQFTGGSNGAS